MKRLSPVAVTVCVSVVLGLGASPAWAANPACPGADSSTATLCTYTTAGNTATFTVPDGVSSLDVVSVGATGGAGIGINNGPGTQSVPGGLGASVEDTAVPVTSGWILGVTVGGSGASGANGAAGGTPGGGGAGGLSSEIYEGVTTYANGGGGGGFSGLFDPSQNPLVIAAAGGGGGAGLNPGGAGDTGGGGQPGQGQGAGGCNGYGGGGGTAIQGGTDTNPFGSRPQLAGGYLQGGPGGQGGGEAGGGGGGGLYGGAGGEAGLCAGGGGGGGSSFGVGPGLTNEQTTSAPASVTISFNMPTPAISTTQQPASVTVGSSVTDSATVSGGNSPTGTVTFNLYSNPNGTGTPLFTDNEPFSGSSATSKSYTTTAAGTDYWVATYNGDTYNNPVSSTPSGEPVTVSAATPSISTTQQPASATVGSSIADQATVSGGDSPTGTVTFNLYNNPNGTGTPLFTDTEPLSGPGATSKGYTTTSTGTDYWVATYNADANNESTSSSPSGEPVTVSAATPSISTTQQPSSATVGASIADQATVTGGDTPTGTVTFKLYNNANATGTPLFTDSEPLSGGSATSKGYTTTATGSDYWVVTYNGDANNNAITSSPSGEPVTITTASKLADLSVTISGPSSAADGSSFSEQVTVSNAGPANAGNVLTALIVPDGVTVTSTGGGTLAFGVVYWTAPQIASHAKATYTVTFKVSAHANGRVLIPAGTASLANPDPNYANNAAATSVTLGGRNASSASVRRAPNPLAVGNRLPALLGHLVHRHRPRHRHA